jgi:hypothetical protein
VDPAPEDVKRVRRAKALRERLRGRTELHTPIPPRPKGMHRKTYERIVDEIERIEWLESQRTNAAIKAGKESLLDHLSLGIAGIADRSRSGEESR